MNQATAVLFEPQGAGQGVGYSLAYDLNDNLGSGLNLNSYTHDIENRLISATTPNDSISFTYDAFGTRTSKTVDGVVTNYILDGNQVIAEYDGSAQLLRRYVYAGLDQPIQMVTPSATYYYHADALGSIIALSDTGANLVETYALGPYGQVHQASLLGNPYLFTGREYDSETGLYYYRNRYYDPGLGRFLEPDPMGTADGLNLYAYVGGNPVNFVDPLGLFATGQSGFSVGSFLDSAGQFFDDIGRPTLISGGGAQLALGPLFDEFNGVGVSGGLFLELSSTPDFGVFTSFERVSGFAIEADRFVGVVLGGRQGLVTSNSISGAVGNPFTGVGFGGSILVDQNFENPRGFTIGPALNAPITSIQATVAVGDTRTISIRSLLEAAGF